MIDTNILGGWKSIAKNKKVDDGALQKVADAYQKLDKEEFVEREKAIEKVFDAAASLQKNKAVTADRDVSSQLTKLLGAIEKEEKEISKAKEIAEKAGAAAAKAEAQKKAEKDSQGAADSKNEAKYAARLNTAFQAMKKNPLAVHQCALCVSQDRELPVVMVTRAADLRISQEDKDILISLLEKPKLPLKFGECQYDGKKFFAFVIDNPPPGLAKNLYQSVKGYTKRQYPIKLGDELVEEEEESAKG